MKNIQKYLGHSLLQTLGVIDNIGRVLDRRPLPNHTTPYLDTG